ncbi:MAG: 2-amino-4-hydroxy-6-hydroxymethyldihydropteridine diphosphokinase [Gammaproteobacteria bacterium]|nr:2-amino-4-hydroxy-6-hydroxymethyldihydropteridine diphosphokinase [Gammaproteobacteria bacterium]
MICYISLGSNLDYPIVQLQTALDAFNSDSKIILLHTSAFYQSKALTLSNTPPQNDYINAVAKVGTTLSAEQLLKKLNEIEASQGRERNEKWGARTLDLDILLYGQLQIQTENLVIPHSQMKYRNFVIHPLFEIAGDINIPGLGELKSLSEKMNWDGLHKIETPLIR